MKILIGCPIYKRDWILDKWFEAIEGQTIPLSDIGFIFELGTNDDDTHDKLWRWHMNHPEVTVFDGAIREDEQHNHHSDSGRQWKQSDYYRMVNFRNSLLDRAIAYEPDRYFSLDSDIILENPKTLEILYDYTSELDVVSPLMFMYPKGCDFPSVMTWESKPGGRAYRDRGNYKWGELFQADVVMAAVMMRPEVYKTTRYQWHRQGEDLGFAWNMAENGFTSYCASDIYCPHIMHTWMLDEYRLHGDCRHSELIGLR